MASAFLHAFGKLWAVRQNLEVKLPEQDYIALNNLFGASLQHCAVFVLQKVDEQIAFFWECVWVCQSSPVIWGPSCLQRVRLQACGQVRIFPLSVCSVTSGSDGNLFRAFESVSWGTRGQCLSLVSLLTLRRRFGTSFQLYWEVLMIPWSI